MSQSEFLAWVEFYKMFPFDAYSLHHRPAALIAASMGGGDVPAMLEWLQPDPSLSGYTPAEVRAFRAYNFTPPKE